MEPTPSLPTVSGHHLLPSLLTFFTSRLLSSSLRRPTSRTTLTSHGRFQTK